MSKEMWSAVAMFRDGENLNAKVLNVPIGQLGARTDYLYARLRELLSSGKMSSVVLTDVELSTDKGLEPEVGNVVYFDQKGNVFAKARATMSLYDDFTAAESAFSIGILQRKDGTFGDVLVYGSMSLVLGGAPLLFSQMLEEGETYRPGRYYLSANEAGKLTAHPNGPLIYVCSMSGVLSPSGAFESGSALVNPQFLDIGTSHVHRTAVLTARPAGTLSPQGYLPMYYDVSKPEDSLAIRFGGTWTSDSEVTYKFWLADASDSWAGGVRLYWKEWIDDADSAVEKHVDIMAPDIEVPISHGLTARMSFPAATPTSAYSGLEDAKRTWGPIVFPEAGKGWLAHMPSAVANLVEGANAAGANPHVAVRGRLDASPTTVNVAFPAVMQILALGSISAGATFSYDGVTYEFTDDSESYSGSNTPVDVGPTLADSALYLAAALNKAEDGRFAVFEENAGASAKLLAMDAHEIPTGGIVVQKTTEQIPGYDVIGADSMKMVVFDGECRVLGNSAVVNDVGSFVWHDIGDGLEIMVFQDVSGSTATICAGDLMSCVMSDDEPDAVYDYAIGFEPTVANYWPPVPAKAAALVVNGVEMDNKALIPDNPTVSFGRSTIHWFSDAEGRRPWPEAFVGRGSPIDPDLDKTEVMHWVRGFQGSTGPVTSLQAREGSPFKIVGFGTDETANVGDLEIVADMDFKMVNGGAPGFVVPKRMRNGRFIGGAVVERIIGGAGIAVISQAGNPPGQGNVIIALDNGAYQSQFSDIALENAEQAKIGMFPYIRLKGYATSITSPSAFTAMMRVPTNLPDGKYALRLQAAVFGENGFTGASTKVACVKFSYNILPDFRYGEGMEYRNLKTSLLKPNSERTVLIPFGHETVDGIVYNGFDPVLIKTDDKLGEDRPDVVANVLGDSIPAEADFYGQDVDVELRPGNLVGIRISRAVTPSGSEAYTGPLGFINLAWSLVSLDGAGAGGGIIPESVIMEAIRELQTEVQGKVSKHALSGKEVYTNTIPGIREAVKDLSGKLGADVVK